MITIIVREGPIPNPVPLSQTRSRPVPDIAATTWNGESFEITSIHGAAMELARTLVAAGCPDQPWETRMQNGQRCLFGNHLHRLAKLTVLEGPDVRGPRIVPWKPLSRPSHWRLDGVEGVGRYGGSGETETP